MSRASLCRPQATKNGLRKSKLQKFLATAAIVLFATSLLAWLCLTINQKKENLKSNALNEPRSLNELLALPPVDLDKCDIALLNLLCAEGLPGSENLDVPDCLKKLDAMADYVKGETQRHEYRFREHPEEFKNSRLYFEMDMLGTILAQDIHIQYNPDIALPMLDCKVPTQATSANSKDIFIHGLLAENHYGTCASMPVLFVALARRLGYPANIAATKLHRYVRCEEPNNSHFNVEATMTEGFLTPTDSDYTNGPLTCTAEEVDNYGWLRPLSNRELLGDFLSNRAVCLGDAKRYAEAKEMVLLSANCFPQTPGRKAGLTYDLENLRVAPLGDKIDAWQGQIKTWETPDGPRKNYFEGRKIQVGYFIGVCPDEVTSRRAMDDLKQEIAEYQRQIKTANPAPEFLEQGLHILEVFNKARQELQIPAILLPPPLNRENIMPDYWDSIANIDFGDRSLVLKTLWGHYKDVTIDWVSQPALLTEKPLHR